MENQDRTNENEQRPNAQNAAHTNPQNASGKPGKEFSSEQTDPLYDQSSESAENVNQQRNDPNASFPQNQPNEQANRQNNPGSNNPAGTPRQFDEKQPIDRPSKDEDQELL